MKFSGDDRVSPVYESIQIDWVKEILVLKVKAYGTGLGTVTYSWTKIDPCDLSDIYDLQCHSCSEYTL